MPAVPPPSPGHLPDPIDSSLEAFEDDDSDPVDDIMGAAADVLESVERENRSLTSDSDMFVRLTRAVGERVEALTRSLAYFQSAPTDPPFVRGCVRCGAEAPEDVVWSNDYVGKNVYVFFLGNMVSVRCGSCGREGDRVTFNPADPREQLEACFGAVEQWNALQAATPDRSRVRPRDIRELKDREFGELGKRRIITEGEEDG